MDHAVQSRTEQTIKNLTVTGIAIYTQRRLQQVSCYSSNENSLPFEIWILGQLHGPMYYKFIQLRPKQNFSKRYALSLTYFTANYCIILNLFNCTFKKKTSLVLFLFFFLINQGLYPLALYFFFLYSSDTQFATLGCPVAQILVCSQQSVIQAWIECELYTNTYLGIGIQRQTWGLSTDVGIRKTCLICNPFTSCEITIMKEW